MNVLTALYAHQDLGYRKFVPKLIPNSPVERIIVVRKPNLNCRHVSNTGYHPKK